jgi:hypothetical protein
LPNNPINLVDVADEDERPDATQEQKSALRGVTSMYATLCYSNDKKRTILESRATTATAKEIRGGKGSIDDEEIIAFATEDNETSRADDEDNEVRRRACD